MEEFEYVDLWNLDINNIKDTHLSAIVNARKVQDNEWYTPYEFVEEELKHWKHRLAGKRIICPCDGPDSAFVKYLNKVKEEWNIKSVDYSFYDITTGEGVSYLDVDYSKYDICITNPPFTKIMRFVNLLISYNIDYILVCPFLVRVASNYIALLQQQKLYLGYGRALIFKPTNKTKEVEVDWITSFNDFRNNFKERNNWKELSEYIYKTDIEFTDNTHPLYIPKIKYFNKNYNGWMYVGIRALSDINPDNYYIMSSGGFVWTYDVECPFKYKYKTEQLKKHPQQYKLMFGYIYLCKKSCAKI